MLVAHEEVALSVWQLDVAFRTVRASFDFPPIHDELLLPVHFSISFQRIT